MVKKKKKIGGQVGERNNILTLSLKENASNKNNLTEHNKPA